MYGLGGLALGGLLVGASERSFAAQAAVDAAKTPAGGRFAQAGGDFSWKPQKLDLNEVEAVAHAGFHYKGYG